MSWHNINEKWQYINEIWHNCILAKKTMKCGILLNEIWQTKNNWKKWQRINEIWHTSGQGIKIHLNLNFPFHLFDMIQGQQQQ